MSRKAKAPMYSRRAKAPARKPANMVKAIRVHEYGGPEVLKWEDVEIGEPGEGEIRVRNKAIGLNFMDVYFRQGVYKVPVPFTPGMETVGEVIAVGRGLTGRKVGDHVAYVGNIIGSYSEEQILPASMVVPVPRSIDPVTAASVLLKGMVAQFLLCHCFKVASGHTILVHTAAGGVGSLLCQCANSLGATVIGTVSTKEEATEATSAGCHNVIIYKEEDFVVRVKEITSGKGVDVIYDSVGSDTFQGLLACLRCFGYFVSFGLSSGSRDLIPGSDLSHKYLFITMPFLLEFSTNKDEWMGTAEEIFAEVASGALRVPAAHTYPLSQAARAHAFYETCSNIANDSVVLIP